MDKIVTFDMNESRQDVLTGAGVVHSGLTSRFERCSRASEKALVNETSHSPKPRMIPLEETQDMA